MRFSDLVDTYDLPARDRLQPRAELARPSPLRGVPQRVRGRVRRRARGRRLAYLDNTFPWKRSGFRYHEALVLRELRPDTLFFSMWELTDPFPEPVHPLASFPTIAAAGGVTDAYGVFQLFLEGIAGTLAESAPADLSNAFAGPDMSAVLAELDIDLHGSIYPGGGFVPSADGYARLRRLADRMRSTLSPIPGIAERVSAVTEIVPAFTDTGFYARTARSWSAATPLTCLFAADAPPRKGIDVVLAAFSKLDPSRFHLHVVGPHLHRRTELPAELATFHGWLSPEALRELHQGVHVVMSPVMAEAIGPDGSYEGVVDGFPTQAAADAVSSGCLLLSANPAADHRVLTPGAHYIDCAAEPEPWREALSRIADELAVSERIADAGSRRLRERMEIRRGVAHKLELMGLSPSR